MFPLLYGGFYIIYYESLSIGDLSLLPHLMIYLITYFCHYKHMGIYIIL